MIKILIVDDHPIFRKRLNVIFEDWDNIKVFEASHAKEMYKILEKEKIDLITLDLNLPEVDGIQILKELKKQYPFIKVLIISMYSNNILVENVRLIGADGFISKDEVSEKLLNAVKLILDGKKYFELNNYIKDPLEEKSKRFFLLTDSEKEIFKLLAEGKNTKEIALILNKKQKTVDNQRLSLMKKMQIKNSTELVKIALKLNIIKL